MITFYHFIFLITDYQKILDIRLYNLMQFSMYNLVQ